VLGVEQKKNPKPSKQHTLPLTLLLYGKEFSSACPPFCLLVFWSNVVALSLRLRSETGHRWALKAMDLQQEFLGR